MIDKKSKFNLSELIDSVKTTINPAANTPKPDPNDAIGTQIAEISLLAQQLTNAQMEQAKELAHLNKLLNGLYKDIELLRKDMAQMVAQHVIAVQVQKLDAKEELDMEVRRVTEDNFP